MRKFYHHIKEVKIISRILSMLMFVHMHSPCPDEDNCYTTPSLILPHIPREYHLNQSEVYESSK